MTRTPYADFMSSAQNPFGQAISGGPAAPQASTAKPPLVGGAAPAYGAARSDYAFAAAMHGKGGAGADSAAAASNQHISKVLAHSTSLLANDTYLTGMVSDSELTSSSRHHHHRPHSSQSRIYHAHPAPRGAHLSSRAPHFSDSLGSYQQHVQSGAKQQPTPSPAYLSHQSSASSTGSGSSLGATVVYLGEPQLVSPLQARQKQGRQLPQRPSYKQSMSIDHHSIGLQQQPQQQYQHQHQSPITSHRSSPIHSALGAHFAPEQQQPQSEPLMGDFAGYHNQVASRLSHQQAQRAPIGDLRCLEMDLIEKQAENMQLYDNEQQQLHSKALPVMASSAASLPPPSRAAAGRQLPPTGSMSVERLHMMEFSQYQPQDQAAPSQLMKQQYHQQKPLSGASGHQQQHHQQEMYPSHQIKSSPADWLPPMGLTSQHLAGRPAAQFKQAMSIDHYPVGGQQQQQSQQQHYSPVRAANLSDHYRASLAAYNQPTGSGYTDSPGRAGLQQQPVGYLAPGDHQELLYQQAEPFVLGAQQQAQAQPQQQKPNLQHQVSSSSSNSQSGSLKSSNLDINKLDQQQQSAQHHKKYHNKAYNFGQQQKSPYKSHAEQQQQHRLPLRRGHTSAVSGSSAMALSESGGELSLSQTSEVVVSASAAQGAGSRSDSGGNLGATGSQASAGAAGKSRSVLRGASPSAPLEATASFSGAPQHPLPLPHQYHHHNHQYQQQHPHHHSASSTTTRDGNGSSSGNNNNSNSGSGANNDNTRSESSTGLPNGATSSQTNQSNLTKKSNSATQLSMTGTKKRLGFRKKQVTSFSVHRSEEIAPLEARHLVKQGSSVSEGDSSISGDSSSRSWSNSNFKQQTPDELASMSFIDGLGKGQMISRQGLASPYLGDIQLSLCDRRGNLEVEVIRARGLQATANKILPLTYVKLYLVKNRKCLAKAKTTLSNKRTLDPLFQQQLTFHEDYHGCILQSIIWGNFGKMDKKNFMGITQISIDDLELSDTVISWYKLFLPSSLQTLPSKSIRHTLLSNSSESFTNTNSTTTPNSNYP